MSAFVTGLLAGLLGIVIGFAFEWSANSAFQARICDVFENTVGFRLRYYRQEITFISAFLAGLCFAILAFVLR